MLGLAAISYFMSQFGRNETQLQQLWFLLAAHIFNNWQSTTTSYGCQRLFGIKCGLYCWAYLKTATVMAACVVVTPLMVVEQCFTGEDCPEFMSYMLSGLLLCGFVLSLMLNPKPLVMEDRNQFARPSEQYVFANTHALVEF